MGRAVANDRTHSVLSKARPLSQTALDAFLGERAGSGPLLPRDTFGPYKVKEVDARTALTHCGLPGKVWSLNPYVGCSHACAYCYVPDVAHLEREQWGSYVVVKRNLPTLLSRELKRRPMREVFLSSATDPYQPVEAQHFVTRRCLELLDRAGWPVRVLTRSPLVRRDLSLLESMADLGIGMSVPTLDDAARRVLEPGAPPIEGRLSTLAVLAEAGLEPFANLAPAYPLTGGLRASDVARRFKEAGVAVVYAGRWNYLDGVLPHLKDQVEGTLYKDFVRAVADDRYYDRLFSALAGAFRREGVRFEAMALTNRERRMAARPTTARASYGLSPRPERMAA